MYLSLSRIPVDFLLRHFQRGAPVPVQLLHRLLNFLPVLQRRAEHLEDRLVLLDTEKNGPH